MQWLKTTCHENAFIFWNKMYLDFLRGLTVKLIYKRIKGIFKLII